MEGPELVVASDSLDGAVILDGPLDSTTFKIDEGSLRRICEKHSILFKDVLVPTRP